MKDSAAAASSAYKVFNRTEVAVMDPRRASAESGGSGAFLMRRWKRWGVYMCHVCETGGL